MPYKYLLGCLENAVPSLLGWEMILIGTELYVSKDTLQQKFALLVYDLLWLVIQKQHICDWHCLNASKIRRNESLTLFVSTSAKSDLTRIETRETYRL